MLGTYSLKWKLASELAGEYTRSSHVSAAGTLHESLHIHLLGQKLRLARGCHMAAVKSLVVHVSEVLGCQLRCADQTWESR